MIKDPENRDEKLRAIRDELLNFTQSPLYKYRIQNNYFPVVGQGNHYAKFMFIGEAPGQNEAKTGRPFCGAAGKILDQLLEMVEIKREDVYITNIVKDRPQNNRDPEPQEIELYAPFLDRQLEIIKPKVIITLGRFSMMYIMKRFGLEQELKPISVLHGTIHQSNHFLSSPVIIIPMYHPAAAIYNKITKEQLYKDFQILKKYS